MLKTSVGSGSFKYLKVVFELYFRPVVLEFYCDSKHHQTVSSTLAVKYFLFFIVSLAAEHLNSGLFGYLIATLAEF